MNSKKTVILGASPKVDRYSNKALKMLREHGHHVVPVHPIHKQIEGIPTVASLTEVTLPIDTITVYVSPEIGEKLAGDMIALKPRRVILNPGAESLTLERQLRNSGIVVERACTLVLLQTGQY